MVNHELFVKLYEENCNNGRFRSKPIRAFNEDGTWNPENWNGGDVSLIRRFIYNKDLDLYNDTSSCGCEIDDDEGTPKDYTVIVFSSTRIGDQKYITITIIDDIKQIITDHYGIVYYKDRGKTEQFTHNGKPITEDEYIELLTKIEKVYGVDFSNY